ncbi:MAG: MnhB domain-containing protein [Halobacteria archaeon]
MTTVILRTTAKLALPIILVFSLTVFLRGHNLPGGGFIAGVLAATGVTLLYMSFSLDFVENMFSEENGRKGKIGMIHRFRKAAAGGLLIALAGGFIPIALGYSFLDQSYIHAHVPVYGDVELASALVFDLGIYVVVISALLTIVSLFGGEEV